MSLKRRKPTMDADRSPSPTRNSPTRLPSQRARPQWLLWALGSGGFAAFNGVFAKLTTTASTSQLAHHISRSPLLEYALRALFFALNLLSNAIMWFLFTRALTAASSTVRVSILNTSANFLVTAVLGMVVFGEGLPGGWWVGAGMLVAGSVVIGGREGKEVKAGEGAEGAVGSGGGGIALPLDGQEGGREDVVDGGGTRSSGDAPRKDAQSAAGASERFADEPPAAKRFTDELNEADDDGRKAAWNT